MTSIVTLLGYLEIAVCIAALSFLVIRKQWTNYWALGWFLAVRAISGISLLLLLQIRNAIQEPATRHSVYHAYYWIYWASFAIGSILSLFILLNIYRLTTEPLKGLQKLGMLLFGIVTVVCVVIALLSVFAPGIGQARYLIASISQLQRTQSILTLCFVLFVFFALRPLGLSFRSNVFGVTLGLGLLAVNDLVQSAWLALSPQMGSFYNLINGIVVCVTIAIWAIYFAMHEPERREIYLFASSPFARLNRMGMAWFD